LGNTTDSEFDNECVIKDDDVENGLYSCDDDDVNSDEEAVRFDPKTAIPPVSAMARNQAVKDAADFYHPDNIITSAPLLFYFIHIQTNSNSAVFHQRWHRNILHFRAGE
jgi:hypothetical protein